MNRPLQLCLSLALAVLLPITPGWLAPGIGSSRAEAAQQRYTCGMHPMIVVDKPGLCPICQMELTPLKEDSGGQGGQVIRIDPVTVQKMGIRSAVAEKRPLVHRIRTVGLAGYAEPGQHAVNTKIGGWVEELMVAESGQQVRQGQPLLKLYSPELVAAQKELLIAVANLQRMQDKGQPEAERDARQLLAAARTRLTLWDISAGQIAALERSGQVERTLTLYAPASGIVSQKAVREGQFVAAGNELMEISSLRRIWVYADIYEDEISWVKPGQPAEVKFPFSPTPVTGRLSRLYPYLDATTRTVKALIELDNPGLELKPEMYADVTITTTPSAPVLAIPAEAVLFTGVRETVFVALGDGRFEPRPVRTGIQDDSGQLEIVSGLAAGERVVTSAQFLLDSESKLREALQKMLEPEPPAPAKKADLDDLF